MGIDAISEGVVNCQTMCKGGAKNTNYRLSGICLAGYTLLHPARLLMPDLSSGQTFRVETETRSLPRDFSLVVRTFFHVCLMVLSLTVSASAAQVIRVGVAEGMVGVLDYTDGGLTGTLSDLYQCVMEGAGQEIQYVPTPLRRGLFYLSRGEVDVLIPLAQTAERDDMARFGGELFSAEYVYVTLDDYSDITDTHGLSYGILRGFVGKVFIPATASWVEEVSSWDQLLPMLKLRRIDVAVMPALLVKRLLGDRIGDVHVQDAGKLPVSLYLSSALEHTEVADQIMEAVETCRPVQGASSTN